MRIALKSSVQVDRVSEEKSFKINLQRLLKLIHAFQYILCVFERQQPTSFLLLFSFFFFFVYRIANRCE